jgi:sulfite reductase (NADPH) flavoprotein alpha-component
LLVLLCTTGLYLRWPRNGHSFREWLVPNFSLRGRSFLHSLHVVLGTCALLIDLVVALTGLQWSYEWYRDGLYVFAGVERSERSGRGPRSGAMWPDLTPAWNMFQRETEETGFSRATIQAPRLPGGALEIRYLQRHAAHPRAYNVLAVDPESGAVVRHERYAEKEAGGKLVASIFALHSGQFFGTSGVLAFMLASLAMPVFAVTGWMLYLGRRRRKARSRMRLGLTAVTQPR